MFKGEEEMREQKRNKEREGGGRGEGGGREGGGRGEEGGSVGCREGKERAGVCRTIQLVKRHAD